MTETAGDPAPVAPDDHGLSNGHEAIHPAGPPVGHPAVDTTDVPDAPGPATDTPPHPSIPHEHAGGADHHHTAHDPSTHPLTHHV